MYMSDALVRYYFLMGPAGRRDGVEDVRWWPDICFDYLVAIRSGFKVRALPLGFSHLQMLHDPKWKHWQKVYGSFGCTLVERPVNIVCCPAGLETGRQLRKKDVGGRMADQSSDPEEVIYEPSFALSACLTDGLRNIAITGTIPKPPAEAEVVALKSYDVVVTPTIAEAAELLELGVQAAYYSPTSMNADATALGILLSGRGDQ